MKYAKFSKVYFGMIPKVFLGLFFYNLLFLELMLVLEEAIGCAYRFIFRFIIDNSTLICLKVIVYPQELKEWLHAYIN